MKDIFLIISIIFGLISPIIGITSVLKGSFKPQRMTRFLIMLISFLFVGTLFAQDDKNGIYIAIAQLIGGIIIFILSIKRGIGGTEKLDFIVLGLWLFSLIIWQTTKNPTLGLLMSIVTDLIGFFPTIIKSWKFPETEEWKFYMSDVIASFFSLLSLQAYTIGVLSFPLYIFLINTTSVLIIQLRRKALIGKK